MNFNDLKVDMQAMVLPFLDVKYDDILEKDEHRAYPEAQADFIKKYKDLILNGLDAVPEEHLAFGVPDREMYLHNCIFALLYHQAETEEDYVKDILASEADKVTSAWKQFREEFPGLNTLQRLSDINSIGVHGNDHRVISSVKQSFGMSSRENIRAYKKLRYLLLRNVCHDERILGTLTSTYEWKAGTIPDDVEEKLLVWGLGLYALRTMAGLTRKNDHENPDSLWGSAYFRPHIEMMNMHLPQDLEINPDQLKELAPFILEYADRIVADALLKLWIPEMDKELNLKKSFIPGKYYDNGFYKALEKDPARERDPNVFGARKFLKNVNKEAFLTGMIWYLTANVCKRANLENIREATRAWVSKLSGTAPRDIDSRTRQQLSTVQENLKKAENENALLRQRYEKSMALLRAEIELIKKNKLPENTHGNQNPDVSEQKPVNSLSEGPEGQIKPFLDEIETLEEKIAELTGLNAVLRSENESLKAVFCENPQNGAIVAAPDGETELFPGEFLEYVMEAVKEAVMRNTGRNNRKSDVLEAVLDANPVPDTIQKRRSAVSESLKGYRKMDVKIQKVLEENGFVMKGHANHYKFFYGDDPRYSITISKTASDVRTGMNSASEAAGLI